MTQSAMFVGGIAVACLLSACATWFPSTTPFDVSTMSAEEMSNGYLLEFPAGDHVTEVKAIVTRDLWLLITMVGATVDTQHVRSLQPGGIVSLVEARQFDESAQVSVKLTGPVRHISVMRNDGNVQIALFKPETTTP